MFSTIHEVEVFFNQRGALGIKPGLERIYELLSLLGNPEKKMKAIHVAGTNGKGSTIYFLNAALRANDYATGIFTSPSYTGLTGHIFLNDTAISDTDFIKILNNIYPHIMRMDEKDMAPSEFEILTAVAFVYLADQCDVVLVETGMGGRFDTTNSVKPILSIITNIALDHIDYLGSTLDEIAFHKAGIIKEQVPVILGEIEEAALKVIKEEIELQGSLYYMLGKHFSYQQLNSSQKLRWKSEERQFSLELAMKGTHQLKNASIALRALEEIEKMGFVLHWEKVIAGLSKIKAPGRYEIISENPTVIVDAAHNPDGIKTFIQTTEDLYANSKKQLITAMFRDKDTEEMLRLLGEHFISITLTSFDHPRAASAEDLYYQTKAIQKNYYENWIEAIHKVLEKEEQCFITGSLHFITFVRDYFQEKSK